tara:strand:- start:279 stop:521 length:243 start_codon:yes stop_codon:yes gene_type:complete
VTSPSPKEKTEPSSESVEVDIPKPKGFIPSTLDELKLVVWPSRQQLFSESIAVILMVTLSAASIAAISRFYGWVASQVFG